MKLPLTSQNRSSFPMVRNLDDFPFLFHKATAQLILYMAD